MPSASLEQSVTIAGVTISGRQTRTAGMPVGIAPVSDIAAAKTGNLTTRTDANTGTLTMDPGHGITTGAIIDIYWDGGVQYNVVVGTVSVNSVPIDSGVGDDLPADESEIWACVQTVIDCDFVGNNLELLALAGDRRCHVQLQQNDATVHFAAELAAGEIYAWSSDSPTANPVVGDTVGKVVVSNGDSSNALKFRGGLLLDAVA